MSRVQINRRDFLKMIGIGAATVTLGAGCSGKSNIGDKEKESSQKEKENNKPKTLKILQQSHFVPAFDEWFDKTYAKKWGEENGVEVIVEHLPFASLYARAAGEAAAQSGHDIFGFASPPAAFENVTIDLADVVSEVEAKKGSIIPLAKNSCYNPKTKKWFGVADFWAADPLLWRKDLWEEAEAGSKPDTWDDLLRVGAKLKSNGYPLGIGISSDLDSNCGLRALLYSYGASIQDAEGKVVINSPQTIEALKMGGAIFKETMTPEILAWSASSNNTYIASGRGPLVVNAVSGLRTIEKKNADLAKNVLLAPLPAGPAKRLGPQNVLGAYVIWKFSPNIDLAKKFLIDYITNYSTAYQKSESYNLPAFPGTVPDLKQLLANDPVADPKDKYVMLATAQEWSTNIGYPGSSNAAENEVFDAFIIPKMFALVAQEMMEAGEAAKWAESAIKPIFEKWTQRGLV
jgi:multiple sugar transport system substrate-binding protein